MRLSPASSLALLSALGVVGLSGAGRAGAQDLDALAATCVASASAGSGPCAVAAVAAGALQAHLGTASGLGSEVAGSASTLGRRLGTSPRLAFSARTGLVRASLPERGTFGLPTIQVGVAAGVFDGFFLLPTVGGFLSLDLVGHASVLLLPSGAGFPERARAFSYGARLGILKESFTLPGVSFSAMRRSVGKGEVGDLAAGDGYRIAVEPSVTSLRATVGKDLLAFGVLAGVGWDAFGGSATIRVDDAVAATEDLEASRFLVFGSLSKNFVVLQLSAEAGLARGFDPVAGYRGTFDPTSATFFGSVAFRLTL